MNLGEFSKNKNKLAFSKATGVRKLILSDPETGNEQFICYE